MLFYTEIKLIFFATGKSISLVLILFTNKTAFKRTRIRSNAACFTHDTNACTCAVCALILHLVANFTGNIFSNSDFLHDAKILVVRCSFSLTWATFHCACTVSTIFLLPV